MLSKQKKRSCTKQYPGKSWKTPLPRLCNSEARPLLQGEVFSLLGPENLMETLCCQGPSPDEWEARTGILTFLSLAAEVELGPREGMTTARWPQRWPQWHRRRPGRGQARRLAQLGAGVTVTCRTCSVSECSYVRKLAPEKETDTLGLSTGPVAKTLCLPMQGAWV